MAFLRRLCIGHRSVSSGGPGGLLEHDWGARNLGGMQGGRTRGACLRCHLGSSSRAGAGRAAQAVLRDICDLSQQPELLQLFHYSCDLGQSRRGKGRGGRFPLPSPSQNSNLEHQRRTITKDFLSLPQRKGLQGPMAGEGEGDVLTFFWRWGVLGL